MFSRHPGEMGACIENHDWSGSGLGPMRRWPQGLNTALEICLDSPTPALVWWGPDLLQFYNDRFRDLLGSEHPAALGIPAHEAWADRWPEMGPRIERPLREDRAFQGEALQGRASDDDDDCEDEGEVAGSCFRYAPLHGRSGKVTGLFIWDVRTDGVVVSPRINEILGDEELEGLKHLAGWLDRIHPADLANVIVAMNGCRDGETSSLEVEFRMSARNGVWKWLLSRGVVVARDREGAPMRLTGVVSDITLKKRADEQTWRHANFDALSGLPNRRLFRDRLDWVVQKAGRSHKRIGLFFIDLDRFKVGQGFMFCHPVPAAEFEDMFVRVAR
ncbi:MAG TPA: PAS domain-containing protein [Aromatoleum sp.]|uniref:PAS domain-containing protein n=1 Tax=Aromatoleum sp. TaxID=2307007 RepID=UPI002B49CCC8|nr:PAS domain-containing protein [Aromatoleum sp.]HJV25528.1 PAS domain-containing protein [Aromatoleum sp.]